MSRHDRIRRLVCIGAATIAGTLALQMVAFSAAAMWGFDARRREVAVALTDESLDDLGADDAALDALDDIGDSGGDEATAYDPLDADDPALEQLDLREGDAPDPAARPPREGIWIGGSERDRDTARDDLPRRIAAMRELVAHRSAATQGDELDRDDGELATDADLGTGETEEPALDVDVGIREYPGLDLERARDLERALELDPGETEPPRLELPWYSSAHQGAYAVLGLALSALLLLLARFDRDPRVGVAGGVMAVASVAGALELASWQTALPLGGIASIEAPLELVCAGVIALTAPRRRTVLIGLVAFSQLPAFISREAFVVGTITLELPPHAVGVALGSMSALGWLVLALVLVGRARQPGERTTAVGPYRTAAPVQAGSDELPPSPRTILRAVSVWLAVVLALRVAVVVEPISDTTQASWSFATGLAIAVAATLAAIESRSPRARQAFGWAAALFFVSPLASVAYGFCLQRVFSVIPFMFVPFYSPVLLLLVTVCFVAGVGLALTGIRARADHRARSLQSAHAPVLGPAQTALVLVGAAPITWISASDGEAPWSMWSVAILAVVSGAYVLRRHLVRLGRWHEDVALAERSVAPAAQTKS